MIKSIRYSTLLFSAVLLCGASATKSCALNFSHEKHLGFGMECTNCHAIRKDGGYEHPTMETCGSCHDEVNGKRGSDACALCHTDTKNYKVERSPHLIDVELPELHNFHVSKQCTACHKNIYTSDKSEDINYPSGGTCFGCHEHGGHIPTGS